MLPAQYVCSGSYCGSKAAQPDLTILLVVVGSAVGLVMVIWIAMEVVDTRLRSRGLVGTAVISAVEGRSVIAHTPDMRVDLTLQVTGQDGTQFEAWAVDRFPILAMPGAGWTVPVRYGRRDRTRIALVGPPVPPPGG